MPLATEVPYMLTLERLKRIVSYNPETGLFHRMDDGTVCGYINAFGYRCLNVAGRPYRAHRLAWFYMTGVMPTVYIDHINGEKADNRFYNLRLATNSQNQANRGASRRSKSGIKGVHYQEARGKWIASIWVNGKCNQLGRFDTKEQASAAYQTASNNAFGEYAHGADPKASSLAPDNIGAGVLEYVDVTQSELRLMFFYDPNTGRFTRFKAQQGQAKAGDIAGSTEWTGQRKIKIRGKAYREHHLAWLYVHGYLPKDEIDHINGDPGDNRIANLRECNSSQNKQNRRVYTKSQTGFKGVGFDDRCVRKYYAQIKVGDQRIYLGSFLTAEDAAIAYENAARAAFGEFAKTRQETQ